MARRTAHALVLLVVSLATVSCGGDDADEGVSPDDAPRDASTAAFCEAWGGVDEGEADPDATVEEQAAAVIDIYRRDSAALQETGTPADIPDDARDGFEILLDATADLTEEMVVDSIESRDLDYLSPVLEGDDATAVEVYTDWADDYCA